MARSHTHRRARPAGLPGPFKYSAVSRDLALPERRSLDEVVTLTPDAMARASRLVTSAYNELVATAASLEDAGFVTRREDEKAAG